MKKKYTIASLSMASSLLLLFSMPALSQELNLLPGEVLPILKDVQVNAVVTLADSGIYTYAYTITNSQSSIGEIRSAGIDITKPQGGTDLSSEGLTISLGVNPRRGVMVIHSFEEEMTQLGSLLEKPVTTIGTNIPDNWRSAISVAGNIRFWSRGKTYRIMPGYSLSGFEILSRGLPAIRSILINPYFKQTPVPEASDEDVERITAIENAIRVTLKTIGPTAPPAVFKPIDFIDYIISQKKQAYSLGWITKQGVENSLDAKLSNAKKKIQVGDTKTAKNILNSFFNELDAQKDKAVNSEAYALLKYNVQYLIGQL